MQHQLNMREWPDSLLIFEWESGYARLARKVLYCQTVSVLVLLCSRVVHSMSSTKEQRVSRQLTSELAVDERERRLQRRLERERACRDSTYCTTAQALWASIRCFNLSSNLVSSDPKFWPSHHDAGNEGGNTRLTHTACAMSQDPWHIVAGTILNSASYMS